MISIIIPANNEEGYIGACLAHILASTPPIPPQGAPPVQIVVVANGCTDATVTKARAFTEKVADKGWRLDVLDLTEGSKIRALNSGDKAALHGNRLYLDADVHVTPGVIAAVAQALDRPDAAYVAACPGIRPARSVLSERYARFWERLPFMAEAVAGCGLFAVNPAARARWNTFPDVISDDTFVRYHFAPEEMHRVPHSYSWPITEGFANLVRVRRRQDEGLAEIRRLHPDLATQVQATAPGPAKTLRLLIRDPLGFAVYAAVTLAVRTPFGRNQTRWARGR